jgi:hypothetical protein
VSNWVRHSGGTGKSWCLTQLDIRPVKVNTLRWRLKRGTEHVWVCPECNEVDSWFCSIPSPSQRSGEAIIKSVCRRIRTLSETAIGLKLELIHLPIIQIIPIFCMISIFKFSHCYHLYTCGTGKMAAHHLLQECPLYKIHRQQIWPSQVPTVWWCK